MRRFFLMAMLITSGQLRAQGANDRVIARDLLDRTRAAYNDLRFVRADSLAREVLALGARISRDTRIEALQLLSAANFPEPENQRRVAAARSAMVQLLKADLDSGIPRDLAWPGLDSLFRDVANSTFAMTVVVRRENAIIGIAGAAPVRVRTNRPSSVVLEVRSQEGIESAVVDSVATATDTVLQLRPLRGVQPLLKGGEFELIVRVTDLASRETITRTFDGVAFVPEFTHEPTPVFDAGSLLPIRGKPQRIATAVVGVIVGAGTVAIGRLLRAGEPIGAAGDTDRRFVAVGATIAVGSIVAGLFDRGRDLNRNRATNDRVRREFEARLRVVEEENIRRSTQYRASITINTEAR